MRVPSLGDTKRALAFAVFGVAVLGAAWWFAFQHRMGPGSSRPQVTPSKALAPRDAAACQRLAAKYTEELKGRRACAVDADCRVEARTDFFATLDGCYRISSRKASLEAANQLAEAWLDASCVEALPACERAPLPACRQGRCGERPPPGVPEDWRRERVPGLLTLFAPPDLRRVPAHGEDSLVVRYEGTSRTLTLAFGEYEPASTWVNPLRTSELVEVAGQKVPLLRYQSVEGLTPPRWEARAKVPDAASPLRELTAPAESSLYFSLDCTISAACDAAPLILSTLELLTERLPRTASGVATAPPASAR
jgi:hypothetical protein